MIIDERGVRKWNNTELAKAATRNKFSAWLCLVCTIFYVMLLIGVMVGMPDMEPEFQEIVPMLFLFALACGGVLGFATVSLFKKQRILECEIRNRKTNNDETENIFTIRKNERKAIRRNAICLTVGLMIIIAILTIAATSIDRSSEPDMEEVWEDVYDWMDENWD